MMGMRSRHFRRKPKKSIEEIEREATRAQADKMLRQLKMIEGLRDDNDAAATERLKNIKEKHGHADRTR